MLRLRCCLAAALLVAGCSKSPSPTDAANAFFRQIANGQTDEAYNSSSFGFQTDETRASFWTAVGALNLNISNLSYSWTVKSADSSDAILEGTVTYPAGKTQPLTAELIKERGAWRVFRLTAQSPNGDIFALAKQTAEGRSVAFSGSPRRVVPSEADLRHLVEDSLMDFNQAVQSGDFATFYATISQAWQDQVSPKRLKNAFQAFVDSKVNLGNLRTATPVFDAVPQIGPDGLLVLQGHYPASGPHPYFLLRYKYELPHWKLMGIDLQIRQ